MAVEAIVAITDVIVTLFLGILGFMLTESFRRHVKQRTAEGRLEAYPDLWELTKIAAPTRMNNWETQTLKGPLTVAERNSLFSQFTAWYYEKGNGIYLGDRTRRLYLAAKHNLICADEDLKPSSLYQTLQKVSVEKRSEMRGELSIRQLSLLRARMRADLEVYGSLFFGELQDEDKVFLKYCGENWRRKPWRNKRPLDDSKDED